MHLHHPLRLRRFGLGVIALAAILAGLATWLRDRIAPGSPSHSATWFLNVLGWLLAVGGAILDAKVGDLLLSAGQRQERRRAMLFVVVGLGVALTSCITIPGRSGSAFTQPFRALLAGLLVGGIGLGLAGAATLLWYYGGRYAANRVAEMGEEDW